MHLTSKDKAAANKDSAHKYYYSAWYAPFTLFFGVSRDKADLPFNYCPCSVQGIPRLNDNVKALLPLKLPKTNPLYQQTLSGCIDPAFGDIQHWKAEPPFVHDPNKHINIYGLLHNPSNLSSSNYHLHTRSLGFVLYGNLMHDQQLQDAQCRVDFDAGWEAAMEALRAEILESQEVFARVSCLEPYHPYHYSREYAMWVMYIRWQAHTLNHRYYLKFLA
ncbi:hypothetical protein K438DRAFT_1989335 [Mycena galopus ATCC 62051]|nr:hypothetical protein K438DRAFT_1989335 [Mycena galopus ATCC 62051]